MIKKWYPYSLCLFAFSLCFFPDWSSKAFVPCAILALFNLKKRSEVFLSKYAILVYLLLGYALFNMLVVAGGFDAKISSLLGWIALFFLLFSQTDYGPDIKNKVLLSFAAGVFTLGVVNLFHFLIAHHEFTMAHFFNSWNQYMLTNIHKIYFAMYLNLAYIFLMDGLLKSKLKYRRPAMIGVLCLTIILLVYTGSVSGIGLFLLLNLLVVLDLVSKPLRNIYATGVLLAPIALLLLLPLPKVQDYFAALDGDRSRISNYETNKELVWQAPVFGYGLGNESATMQSHRDPETWEYRQGANAHNQYFESLLGGGIPLLLLLLALPTLLFIKSLRTQNGLLPLAFVLLLCNTFAIESVIRRHHGMLYYAFFLTLFMLPFLESLKKKRLENSEHKQIA